MGTLLQRRRGAREIHRARHKAVFTALATPNAGRSRAPGKTLVVGGDYASSWLVREACLHARAGNDPGLYWLYVGDSAGAERKAFADAASEAHRSGVRLAPIARSSRDVAEAVARAADEIDARVVIMEGVDRHGLIARLRGRGILRRIRRRLSLERTLILYA